MTDNKQMLMDAKGIFAIYKGKAGTSNVVALRGINLEVQHGEFISIVGPSGSGKSTLMRCLGGLQRPSAGSIFFDTKDIAQLDEDELVPFRREKIGFIFQEGNLLESLSGYQNVVRTLRYAGTSFTQSRKRASEILDALGMTSRMHSLPSRLSGGERQRVAIARALANQPSLVIADEPTGNIDYGNTENVMGIFGDLHKDMNTSFLLVTHSQHVASFAERSIELRDGRFTGQHTEIDVDDLTATREVIINHDGTLTLPPDILPILEKHGNLWDFRLKLDNKVPRIIATPSSAELSTCPVCKNPVAEDLSYCTNCGATLKY